MPDNTLTTQIPGQPPETRPVPPSWATVAPLLARWQIALVPHPEGTWDVFPNQTGLLRLRLHPPAPLPWREVPQAIADLAAQYAAAAEKGEA
jgi:hypothetical protein